MRCPVQLEFSLSAMFELLAVEILERFMAQNLYAFVQN